LKKYTGITLRGIADFYGNMNYKTVSTIYRRLNKKRMENRALDKLLKQIEASLEMANGET